MRILLLGFLALVLSGCASTQMKGYVGKSIEEANLELGKPENVIKMSSGRRAYQYRWGGGSAVIPGSAKSTITGDYYSATVKTTYKPATIVTSKGCLVTLIATKKNGLWMVSDWKIPQKLVC